MMNIFAHQAKKITSKSRTSLNAWCRDACERDTNVASLTNRIARFTGIPDERFEFFQVLKYAPGQYAQSLFFFFLLNVFLLSHHDFLLVSFFLLLLIFELHVLLLCFHSPT